jgi:hypothetical protein
MIRRETFNDVGLLDEDLFIYGDDADWPSLHNRVNEFAIFRQ